VDEVSRRFVDASVVNEDQGSMAMQAYMESVMNRAIARKKSLDQTISDANYYPRTTLSKLNRQISKSEQQALDPLIEQVLAGSNLANYATGNESGSVRSGGAPIVFNPRTGERFVIEKPDAQWARQMGWSA
jgi:hypothetical protein